MSLRAVGWLSTVLGLNIDGRADGDEGEHRAPSASPAGPAGPAAPAGVDAYLHRLNDALFGGDGAPPAGGAGGAEDVALDASGLPVTTNWYYYDKDLGRWNVSPDAPAAIQEEYQRRLREEAEAEAEGERSGRQNAPPPPPPPPPPPGAQPVQQGLWSTQAHTQSSKQSTFPQRQGGPQYAVPMYFNTTTPMQTGQVPQAPQQAQHHVLQSDQQAVLPQVPYNPQEQYAYQQQPQDNQHITQDQQYHQQHYQLRSGPGPQSQAIHSLPMSPGYRDEAHSSGY